MDSMNSSHEANSENFPESIYGAGMSFIVQSVSTTERPVHGLSLLIGLALVGNIVLQISAIWSVKVYITTPAVFQTRKLYAEFESMAYIDGVFSQDAFDDWDVLKKRRLCALPFSQPVFSLMILFIWTMAFVIEVKHTVLFAIWWQQLPKSEGADVTLEMHEESGTVLVSAASSRTKASIFGLILIPKMIIAVILWWLGARWLCATTNLQDLVLNAVALAFIIELDEMTFQAIVPHRAIRTLSTFRLSVPPANGNSSRKVYKWIAQMVGKFAVMILVPLAYMLFFQQVLPGYRFDVHEPCAGFLEEQMLAPAS
uniref:Uncharacterized protein n=1 Tax=Alexandrium catenella TaxID=2925 RepID=A0A7S1LBA6_ALECA